MKLFFILLSLMVMPTTVVFAKTASDCRTEMAQATPMASAQIAAEIRESMKLNLSPRETTLKVQQSLEKIECVKLIVENPENYNRNSSGLLLSISSGVAFNLHSLEDVNPKLTDSNINAVIFYILNQRF
jgi:hypothetical protein